jgi:hypothetical protein
MKEEFGRFDCVKVKENLDTCTIYGGDIRLRRGKRGCVIEPGEQPDSYIVEFKIGRGMRGQDYTEVELDADDLVLEVKIGDSFKTEAMSRLSDSVAVTTGKVKRNRSNLTLVGERT